MDEPTLRARLNDILYAHRYATILDTYDATLILADELELECEEAGLLDEENEDELDALGGC